MGKEIYFVTNACSQTRGDLQKIAESRGYHIGVDNILSVSYIVAKYLHELGFNKKVYLVGTAGISKELESFGIRYIDSDLNTNKVSLYELVENGLELEEDVGAVIVSFDTNFHYSKLLAASNYLKDPECLFLATSYDELYPSKRLVLPGIGPNVAALEVATGRKAKILGKPNDTMCGNLLSSGAVVPERTLMIGDTAKYDIVFGKNCGFQTMLVGSGINNMNDVQMWQKSNIEEQKQLIPDVYLRRLGDLLTHVTK